MLYLVRSMSFYHKYTKNQCDWQKAYYNPCTSSTRGVWNTIGKTIPGPIKSAENSGAPEFRFSRIYLASTRWPHALSISLINTGRPDGWDREQSLLQDSLEEPTGPACLRTRPTDSLHAIPSAEFVGMGRRRFMGIEEH